MVFGLDTSCYTTSAAIAASDGSILAFERKLLPVEEGGRGLRQSDAVFIHVKQLPEVLPSLTRQMDGKDCKITAVCASASPRDEEGSYMPVFAVGLSYAKSMAAVLNVPLYTTSHQQGHIEAGLIGNTRPNGPFCAMHLSGGTTELLLCDKDHIRVIGGSRDLHAGQLLDRIGVKLGYRFPAGAEMERLAVSFSQKAESLIPVSMESNGLFCHLSGAENAALRMLGEGMAPEQAAAELFDFLARNIARMGKAAYELTGVSALLIVGGVASSLYLRELIGERICKMRIPLHLIFGEKQYSADNAAGVARIGMQKWLAAAKPEG